MQTYIAHYISPAAADVRGTGLFEFESDSRANTKGNLRDARLKMLELYGKDAVSWTIDSVRKRTSPRRTANWRWTSARRSPSASARRRKSTGRPATPAVGAGRFMVLR